MCPYLLVLINKADSEAELKNKQKNRTGRLGDLQEQFDKQVVLVSKQKLGTSLVKTLPIFSAEVKGVKNQKSSSQRKLRETAFHKM